VGRRGHARASPRRLSAPKRLTAQALKSARKQTASVKDH
jgi:hypothetical protein